jgi:chorismate mutase
MEKEKTIEVCRSFSFKLNLGNYSNADFFCSQKAEVLEGDAEKVSEQLYEFCKKEVMKSVSAYKKENAKLPTKAEVKDSIENAGREEQMIEKANEDAQIEAENIKEDLGNRPL